MQRTRLTLIVALASLLLATGCQTSLARRPDHVQRLLDHPELGAANKAAPGFVSDALHTINNLQRDLALAESR